jgi:hypothetical protein
MTGPAVIGFNTYLDAGYRYGVSGSAGYLSFNTDVSGGFSFATAPPGVQDSVATTTPRMVVTAGGLVGIGTTAPTAQFNVIGSVTVAAGTFSSTTTDGTGVEGRANVGSNAWGVFNLSGTAAKPGTGFALVVFKQ